MQSQLIRVTKLFMTHQHLLDRCLEQLLAIEADKLLVEGLEDCDAQSYDTFTSFTRTYRTINPDPPLGPNTNILCHPDSNDCIDAVAG